jgi:hypothetical protein
VRLLRDLLADVLVPLRALAVALAGVALALAWFHGYRWLAIIGAILAVLSGALLERLGARSLPGDPVRAARLMEFWVISPAAVSALAAMIVIAVSVRLTAPKDAPPVTTELLAATAGALTAFLSSAFIDWAGDKDDSRTADRIRDRFYDHYKRADDAHPVGFSPDKKLYYFEAESEGELWVYSDEHGGITGWGHGARRKRAAAIAALIASAGRAS